MKNWFNSPFLGYDAVFYLLALVVLFLTGSVIMLAFALVFACLLAIDLRRVVPQPQKEEGTDDDSEQTPDA